MASKNRRTEYLATKGKFPVSITHPHLMEEWDFERNEIRPEEITYGSDKKIWWSCSVCVFNWYASISHRAIGGRGCPRCAGKVVCDDNSLAKKFPEVAKEWHPTKNNISGTVPGSVTYGSGERAWWLCGVCGGEWESRICNRTSLNRGCPYCSGRRVSDYNRLSKKCPHLEIEWHPIKNINIGTPDDFSYSSHKVVWWLCSVCGNDWAASISNRVYNDTGCPACSGHKVSYLNRLDLRYPLVASEWSYKLNGSITPAQVSYNSSKYCWWVCSDCKHEWETRVYVRTRGGSGCPLCAGGPVSRVSQRWLDTVGVPSEYREHRIGIGAVTYIVDGYDPETSTVYEFLGDFWHGNPEIYERGALNTRANKTFGELYDHTFERIKSLEEAGYKVVYIWEKDFRLKGEDL